MNSGILSQDLSSHRWEDRLILIFTEDTGSTTYKEQIDELYSNQRGLSDRKIVIYTVMPEKFKRDDRKNRGWIQSDLPYRSYKQSDSSFEIILIGLDGSVKLRKNSKLTNRELFGSIDQMPMRRNELRNHE